MRVTFFDAPRSLRRDCNTTEDGKRQNKTNRKENLRTMNALRRRRIDKISAQLQELKDQLEELLQDEQEAFDNIPEAFEGTDRYTEAEEKLDYLDSAFGGLEEVIDNLTEATN